MTSKRMWMVVILALATVARYSIGHFYAAKNDFVRRYPVNVGSFQSTGGYKIDPKTILDSIANGNRNVFQPEEEQSQAPIPGMAIAWSQATYQRVADALYQTVWKESSVGWSLYRMHFHTACQDSPSGFDYADFTYFKDINLNGEKLYAAREIFMNPQYGDVSWGGDTNFPRPMFGWRRIDLTGIQFAAEEALRTAETKGGQEARLSVQNQCQIHVLMNPEAYGYDDWKVSYSGNSSLPSVEIRVSPK
jgi:hypothetical protein